MELVVAGLLCSALLVCAGVLIGYWLGLRRGLASAVRESRKGFGMHGQRSRLAASIDGLTGIPNRTALNDELARCIDQWRRTASPFCVMLADIDRFKPLNDQHGHLAGDAVLRRVAASLTNVTRGTDLVARFGGDEFAVILPQVKALEASQVAQRARKAIQELSIEFDDQQIQVTASFGVAQALPDESDLSIVKRADWALYAAKKAGRNSTFWHDGTNTRPVAPCAAPEVPFSSTTPRAAADASDAPSPVGPPN